jgi:hypothetical protein
VVFDGPSGSGRRTVAGLFARSLAELGLVPSGALTRLVLDGVPARWLEQAAAAVGAAAVDAEGGVLLLDLDGGYGERPETERARVAAAVRAVLRARPGTVVVVCGPTPAVAGLLGGRDGLAGAFAEHLRFTGYTPAESAELAVRRLARHGLDSDSAAAAALADELTGGSARAAHRLADRIAAAATAPEIGADDVRRVLADPRPHRDSGLVPV